ncbi:MAG: NADH-quinone oxidoreductase subunit N [Thermoleophilia bacterium]|nr:NADH-quinone oxidoreductase subunit N [Actinomycetota bacterium]MDA8167557.1 NADH-quinone oxidoreductase subunit N [Actinomycetota bacterium]
MSHDILAIVPELMLVVTAIVLLLIDPMLPHHGRRGLSWLGILACGTAAVSAWLARNEQFSTFSHGIALDRFTIYFKILLLLVAALAMLLSEQHLHLKKRLLGDYYALILLATVGMMVMASAIDLTVFFVGLELMSLASYLLAGFLRYNSRSIEAGLKYFLTGSFASAILLFGMALLYGVGGSTNYQEIGQALRSGNVDTGVIVIAIVLLLGGFAFKVAAAPFHSWAPDVYQGAPTPTAAFLSVGPKIAAFAVIIKFFTIILGGEHSRWVPLVIAMAIATMLIGATMALLQRDLKRLLGFSSVAHVGYLLLAVVAMGQSSYTLSSSAILFYLAAYAAMNMGAFGVLTFMANAGRFGDSLDEMAGLGRRYPGVAGVMAVLMFSLAGIPPTAGFLAKFYLFASVVDAGYAWLAVIGVLFSVVSAFYYLRVIVYMYMREPEAGALEGVPSHGRSFDLSLALGLATAAVLALGMLPGPVLNAAQDAVGKILGS